MEVAEAKHGPYISIYAGNAESMVISKDCTKWQDSAPQEPRKPQTRPVTHVHQNTSNPISHMRHIMCSQDAVKMGRARSG